MATDADQIVVDDDDDGEIAAAAAAAAEPPAAAAAGGAAGSVAVAVDFPVGEGAEPEQKVPQRASEAPADWLTCEVPKWVCLVAVVWCGYMRHHQSCPSVCAESGMLSPSC